MSRKKTEKEYVIREGREQDLPLLVEFLVKLALHVSGGEPKDLRESEHKRLLKALSSSLKDEDKHLVVADSSEAGLVGMGYVYVWSTQGIWAQTEPVEFRSGMIDDVWVEPEFRHRGIFKALLRDLVAFAESHNVSELILEYSATNKEAEAAWTKLGFRPTGIRAAAFTSNVKQALAKQQ
ncbi:GNAT family N-acetyltransferase [Marinobacter subterrani]|uniref:Ribosomal protein S18 acetylase RimI n=1 Tax=Marinobacter subterrani TaxID=1658765 RepID=A0A0J7J868_9GAMM|nr:GNAT family N-acetyltransferase [Marinobacter subterrani]KMQ74144.1 Ribosomal protein S18 acetylase RimI [Marinobacter subterrani]